MKNRIFQIVLLVIFTLLVYTVANATHVVRTEYTFTSDKLVVPYKLVYISDTHYGCCQKKEVIDRTLPIINAEEADVILLGGDIVQASVTSKNDMEEILSKLGKLSNKYGVYFVYGNHDKSDDGTAFDSAKHTDYYSEGDLIKSLNSNGIYVLKDSSVYLPGGLVIIGRTNALGGRVRKDISSLTQLDDNYTICLDHVPTGMTACQNAGVDLQLSGHTHGGQLFPINLLCDFVWELPSYGLHKYGDMKLVVSSGMGVGAYTLRNVHHCEYVVINLLPTK